MFKDKVILITGGTGSLGNKLVEKLLPFEPKKIIIFSRNEKVQHEMRMKYPNLEYRLGAVEDYNAVMLATYGVDIVFHCGATKHVNIGEIQPIQTCNVNVIGSMNVVSAAIKNNVKTVVGISTDKACNPYNVYGLTKHLMERMFFEANKKSDTKFFIVRYGNVLGSNGSVVPFWINAAKKDETLKVTDPNMTRFYFTLDDAVDLIFDSLKDGDTSVIYSIKMAALKLGDLAEVISSKPIEIIGNRGGEKINEALLSDEEMGYTEEVELDNFTMFKYHVDKSYKNKRLLNLDKECNLITKAYTSDKAVQMSKDDIKTMLIKAGFNIWL